MAQLRRIISGLVILLLSLPLIGILYERWAIQWARRTLQPIGRLVEVDGRQMHLITRGKLDSKLTVVFESGAGGFAPEWRDLMQRLGDEVRCVTYDRAGHGWSDESPFWRTPRQIAYELRDLLHTAGVPKPYLLVGHSLGGIYVLQYAALFPQEVAGVVLVDASHPAMNLRPEIDIKGQNQHLLRAYLRAITGYQRLTAGKPDGHFGKLSPQLLQAYLDLRPRSVQTMYQEVLNIWSEPLPRSIGTLPLVVITRTASDSQLSPAWQELQADLATFSSAGQQIIAAKAGHDVHLDDPELVETAIRDLIQRLYPPNQLNGKH
jgi:pimeloyl-ACP methyl ester carboxylesterase